MSVVNITFDTKTKVLDVNLDGKKQKDIAAVNIYKYSDEEAHIELTKIRYDEENSLQERICLYANETFKYNEFPKDYCVKKLTEELSKYIG